MKDVIMQLLADFLEATDEYRLEDMPVCSINFVKDIFEAVAQIDEEYAEDVLSSKDQRQSGAGRNQP